MNLSSRYLPDTSTQPRLPAIRCVAIDDDSLFLKMLGVLFQDIPSAVLVETFTNSVEGIMAVVKLKPDVILLDVEMPYLNGIEALETLDRRPKVIVISGHIKSPEDLGIPVDKFISKTQLQSAEVLKSALVEVTS